MVLFYSLFYVGVQKRLIIIIQIKLLLNLDKHTNISIISSLLVFEF